MVSSISRIDFDDKIRVEIRINVYFRNYISKGYLTFIWIIIFITSKLLKKKLINKLYNNSKDDENTANTVFYEATIDRTNVVTYLNNLASPRLFRCTVNRG